MLFKMTHLEGIRSGQISLAFRSWKRPSVTEGAVIKTAIGLVAIKSLKPIIMADIREADARSAGYESTDALLRILARHPGGQLYRMEVEYKGEDPRLSLREISDLSEADILQLKEKLDRYDQFSRKGPWTLPVLHAIRDNTGMRAADLAVILGYEKSWLKPNVRKLKELGLTISLEVGYSISPRGMALLEAIDKH